MKTLDDLHALAFTFFVDRQPRIILGSMECYLNQCLGTIHELVCDGMIEAWVCERCGRAYRYDRAQDQHFLTPWN